MTWANKSKCSSTNNMNIVKVHEHTRDVDDMIRLSIGSSTFAEIIKTRYLFKCYSPEIVIIIINAST